MSRFERDFALADALDRALAQPVDLRRTDPAARASDLASLQRTAERLKVSAAQVRVPDEFRAASRQRLLGHMAKTANMRSLQSARQPQRTLRAILDRFGLWAARVTAALAALSFAGVATASASANALPGDPLYGVKQATEALAVHIAPDDATRQEILLRQADTRLDEAERLLAQGRDAGATTVEEHYEATLARAANASTWPSEAAQASLQTNQTRLTHLLQTAPPPARAGLQRALEATQRSLGRSRPVPPALTEDSSIAAPIDRSSEAAATSQAGQTTSARTATDSPDAGRGDTPGGAPGEPRGNHIGPGGATPHADTESSLLADTASSLSPGLASRRPNPRDPRPSPSTQRAGRGRP